MTEKEEEKKEEEKKKEEIVKAEEPIVEPPKEGVPQDTGEQLLGKVNESMRGRLESEIDRDDDFWKHLEVYRQYQNLLKG